MAYRTRTAYPTAHDAGHGKVLQSSWSDARDAATSDSVSTGYTVPVASWRLSGRGGVTYYNYRYFAKFLIEGVIPWGSAIMKVQFFAWYDNTDGTLRVVLGSGSGDFRNFGVFETFSCVKFLPILLKSDLILTQG